MGSRITSEKTGSRRFARSRVREQFEREGLVAHEWSNDAGVFYERHSHPFRDIIRCVAGSITFHTSEEDYALIPGTRFEMDPRTEHAATVGPEGVLCLEAQIPEGVHDV